MAICSQLELKASCNLAVLVLVVNMVNRHHVVYHMDAYLDTVRSKC